jgi:LPXTG-motif cell wall-anchored protein
MRVWETRLQNDQVPTLPINYNSAESRQTKGKRYMSKLTILLVAALFTISTAYDFYRGYHQTHSVIGGIVYAILGLVILGAFLWLYSKRKNSN